MADQHRRMTRQGRILWRAVASAYGWERQLRTHLSALSIDDIHSFIDIFHNLLRLLEDELKRRAQKTQAKGVSTVDRVMIPVTEHESETE